MDFEGINLDDLEEVEEQQDDSEIWKPEEGDSILGRYVGKQVNVGKNNSTLYSLETSDGMNKVWGSTVLDGKFNQISEGAIMQITYNGKKAGSSGWSYKDFTVKVTYD